jgi:hypothetical protein
MRTSVEFPDTLLEKAREAARSKGITLRELLIEALELRLAADQPPKKPRRDPPTISATPGSPACGLLTREQIDEAMFG